MTSYFTVRKKNLRVCLISIMDEVNSLVRKFRTVLRLAVDSNQENEVVAPVKGSNSWVTDVLATLQRADGTYPDEIRSRLHILEEILKKGETSEVQEARVAQELKLLAAMLPDEQIDRTSYTKDDRTLCHAREFVRYCPLEDCVRFISPLSESSPPDFDITYANLADEEASYYLRHSTTLGKILVRGNQLTDICASRMLSNAGRGLTVIDMSENPQLTQETVTKIGMYIVSIHDRRF
jgi:hypothetical protein